MGYIGKTPTPAPLTSSDIAADIINSTHIGDTAISGFDALATSPADTDEFLISDGGVLKRLDASLVGGGKLGQVVQTVDTTNRSSNSTSFVSTGVEVSITPSATSSKVFLICNWSLGISADNRRNHAFTFNRDSTDLTPTGVNGLHNPCMPGTNATYHLFPQSMSFLDSPSSTSAITYKFMWKINSSYQYLGRRGYDTDHDGATIFTAIEILA